MYKDQKGLGYKYQVVMIYVASEPQKDEEATLIMKKANLSFLERHLLNLRGEVNLP